MEARAVTRRCQPWPVLWPLPPCWGRTRPEGSNLRFLDMKLLPHLARQTAGGDAGLDAWLSLGLGRCKAFLKLYPVEDGLRLAVLVRRRGGGKVRRVFGYC